MWSYNFSVIEGSLKVGLTVNIIVINVYCSSSLGEKRRTGMIFVRLERTMSQRCGVWLRF